MQRAELQERFRNALVLAPLTKGGNLPFRRLCVAHGVDITYSEMAYARFLKRGETRERALIRRHQSESCFGVQLAALQVEEALEAAKIVADAGADFIDINCGCPIDDVVRRGLGAALLRRPNALFRLVEALATKAALPVTVKIRSGFKEGEINAHEIARGIEEAGAAVLAIHGRTREQRYSKAADWDLIGQIARERTIPVIGNGDILTFYEAEERQTRSGVAGMMIGRGALIKPWIFREIKERREFSLSNAERIAIYWELAQYMKEHFRDDEKGRRRMMGFLPWHFSLFHRYESYPEAEFRERSRAHPLMQTRSGRASDGEPLSRLLASADESTHVKIGEILLGAADPAAALALLQSYADEIVGPQLDGLKDVEQFSAKPIAELQPHG